MDIREAQILEIAMKGLEKVVEIGKKAFEPGGNAVAGTGTALSMYHNAQNALEEIWQKQKQNP